MPYHLISIYHTFSSCSETVILNGKHIINLTNFCHKRLLYLISTVGRVLLLIRVLFHEDAIKQHINKNIAYYPRISQT